MPRSSVGISRALYIPSTKMLTFHVIQPCMPSSSADKTSVPSHHTEAELPLVTNSERQGAGAEQSK